MALVQAKEQATGRERKPHRVKGPLATAEAEQHQAGEGVQEDLRVEANLAWAGTHPTSWISSLCADPLDSPRPKGWETTLEPYRTSSNKLNGSLGPALRFKPTVPIL